LKYDKTGILYGFERGYMTVYIIRTQKNPNIYYHRETNCGNINTALRFTKEQRIGNKSAVLSCNYEYMKFDDNGRLVVVPFESEE
jgi:hypothetical protein